jgi:hypothetical protein
MTTRERHLTAIVAGILGVAGIGVVSYWFVISPLLEKDKQIKLRENEVAQLELDIMTVQAEKKKYEVLRHESLPADVGVSRTQYYNLLEGLIRRADFAGGTYKITVGEPDNKSAPTIAIKKPAYTKLMYDVTLKGQVYHVVDFLQLFYRQPLLHSIKSINIQRPSDQRAQQTRQVDVVLKIEALVLENAPTRPTLLPLIREIGLLSGGAGATGLNMKAVADGRGAPIPPTGVLADVVREYLAIAGKDIFFGPAPKGPRIDQTTPLEEDHSPFVTLTSVTGHDDGSIEAVFRDKLDNHNYTITQSPKGEIAVKGEYEIRPGKTTSVPGYDNKKPGRVLFYGLDETGNRREWRIRRVLLDAVIVERIDNPDAESKPKPHPLAAIGGGPGAFVAVPDAGKIFRVNVGQDLETDPKDPKPEKRSGPPPTILTSREAWRAIYAPLVVPTAAGGEGK